jgi:hypothetical protein
MGREDGGMPVEGGRAAGVPLVARASDDGKPENPGLMSLGLLSNVVYVK